MAKPFGGKRPQDLRHTLRRFMDYLGRHKIMLGVVGLLAAVSALAALLGTYMIRPIVNGVLENGSAAYLAGVVALTAGIYIVGALSTLGYTQLMVRAAQKILQDIRRDLFAHLQTLPLHYFDTNRKGDLMSLFTNDVDTISDALNNSFAVVIQTFIQVAGTLLLLFILNWRLSLLVVVGYIAMFWYINYSTQRSRAFYARQQASLGELDAYMEEMIAGQKVVKVFNHQQADMAAFAARNEKLREAGTGAQSYAATMIPAVVSIGYLNYAVIAVVGGLMVMWGWSDLGSLASYLVFVRQTTLPINQLTQQGNFLLAALAGAEDGLLAPPTGDVLVIAGAENGGDLPAVPLLGAGVLGVLQQAVPVALLLEALRVGEHPGHQSGHRVGHHHGGQLAAGEYEVADGDLLVHTLLNEPLVDALIVAAYQNQVVVIVPQAAGVGLHEGFAGGGHVDGMSRAEGVHNVLPALV